MMLKHLTSIAALFSVVAACDAFPAQKTFPNGSVNTTITIAELRKNPQTYNGRRVRVSGSVASGGFGVGVIVDRDKSQRSLQIGSFFTDQRVPSGTVVIEGVFDDQCVIETCTDFYSDFKELKLIYFTPGA